MARFRDTAQDFRDGFKNADQLKRELLRNGDGGYRDDLYAARMLLRKEMDGSAWSLGGQIVPG